MKFILLPFILINMGIAMDEKIPEGLGLQDGRLASMPDSPNAVSSQTDIAEKKVEPLAFKQNKSSTKKSILASLKEMGGNEVIFSNDHYIYTVFTSFVFRFKDDVEFYLDEKNKQLHFRSASRIGHSDLGANRKRYDKFKELYSK